MKARVFRRIGLATIVVVRSLVLGLLLAAPMASAQMATLGTFGLSANPPGELVGGQIAQFNVTVTRECGAFDVVLRPVNLTLLNSTSGNVSLSGPKVLDFAEQACATQPSKDISVRYALTVDSYPTAAKHGFLLECELQDDVSGQPAPCGGTLAVGFNVTQVPDTTNPSTESRAAGLGLEPLAAALAAAFWRRRRA